MVATTRRRRSRLASAIAGGVCSLALLAGCAAGGGGNTAAAARVGAARAVAHAAAGHATARHAAADSAARTDVSAASQAAQAQQSASPAASSAATPAASPAAAPAAAPAASSAAAVANGPRRVTFINKIKRTIWVAAAPDAQHPLARTGWVLKPGQRVTITVPNHWNGRFWGRTGCVFHHGKGHCATGDCGGLFQCTGWGAIPATLAEYDLDAWGNLDFYDVSMVDGSNLPMYIYPTSGQATKKVSKNGCVPGWCTHTVDCPQALRIYAGGKYVACESACDKLGGDQYCCRGQYAPRADCNPAKWPVDYARVFKRAEHYAYSYVDDDATSVYVCTGRCNYNIVFGITPRE